LQSINDESLYGSPNGSQAEILENSQIFCWTLFPVVSKRSSINGYTEPDVLLYRLPGEGNPQHANSKAGDRSYGSKHHRRSHGAPQCEQPCNPLGKVISILDPSTKILFRGNIVPVSRFDPAAVKRLRSSRKWRQPVETVVCFLHDGFAAMPSPDWFVLTTRLLSVTGFRFHGSSSSRRMTRAGVLHFTIPL
jgi:hypothetical protein